MKISKPTSPAGFTLIEMFMSLGCGSIILAAVVTAGVSLQKSFAAMENYSNTQGDQLRVLDYIAMDCRRATAVTVNNNQLTLTLPVYYNSSSSYAAYTPTLSNCSSSGCTISYGSGSVTVSYQQSGTNFTRVVTVLDSGGNTVSGYPQTTTIAKNVSTFTITPQNLSASVSCSIMFFPNFLHNTGTGTWWSGQNNPDKAPSSGVGANGDWYVINDTGKNNTPGDVYYKASGSWSKVQNVKATTLYINTFLRTAAARSTNNT